MPVSIESIDVGQMAEAPASERQRRLFEIWTDHQGCECSELLELADHLVFFGMPMETCVPNILFMGDLSLARIVMRDGWRQELAGHISDEAAGTPYVMASHGEPALEHVCFSTMRDGMPKRLEYQRAVLPFRTNRGFPYIVTLSTALCATSIFDHQPSLENQERSKKPSNSHVVLGSVAPPILVRSVSAASS